jgi:hypothetical protein
MLNNQPILKNISTSPSAMKQVKALILNIFLNFIPIWHSICYITTMKRLSRFRQAKA